MLVEVMRELRPFLFIYFITIIAFADAFNSLNNSQLNYYVNTHQDKIEANGGNMTEE